MVNCPWSTSRPPTQNTTTVPTALIRLTVRKNQRMRYEFRTPAHRTRSARARNRPTSLALRPNSLTSSAPDTLSVSSIMAFISALSVICSRTVARTRLPSTRAGIRNSGRTAAANSVSRQSSLSMMARALTSVITFANRSMNVPVTARCAPITSLFSRDISSPVFVFVKNRSDMLCRWLNRAVRRSLITPSPTVAL